MSKFVIEKGVPMPTQKGKGLFSVVKLLEVGDSVFAPCDGNKSGSLVNLTALKPRKYSQRKVEGGYRIWRVE